MKKYRNKDPVRNLVNLKLIFNNLNIKIYAYRIKHFSNSQQIFIKIKKQIMKKKILFISPKHLEVFHNVSPRTARKYLLELKLEYNIPPKRPLPVIKFCQYHQITLEEFEKSIDFITPNKPLK
jgi:hypothetical protein